MVREVYRAYGLRHYSAEGTGRGIPSALYYGRYAFYGGASILQASKEIHLFAERTHRMFGMVRDLLHTEKDDDFNKLFSRIEKYENISDSMELEIANYLNQVSEGRLSSESKLQIRAMLREVTEIESIGDSCYNLARTINRKRQTNQEFTEKQYEHIHFMMKLTDDALGR